MSQIENVLTTTFRARGGNVVAQLGSYAQGFGRLGMAINDNTRMSERLNNQWRAFGTTLRYAIAGGAIFGLTRLVGQLKDVNVQLGLMSAIGSGPSGAAFSSSQIDRLFEGLQTSAVNAIIPVSQINAATVNFLSTVQNVPSSEIPAIMQSIGQAATLAQTPVEALTQAVTTANIAFGRTNNMKNIAEMNRMWYALISTAPGGIAAAPQIAQAMPSLASMWQLAPGRAVSGKQGQAQMMAMILGLLRTGMPPSTAMRGGTYLLQSLAQPTGGARNALAGIGITSQFVQEQGINAALFRLLRTITKTGNAKQLGAMSDESLDALDESGGNLPGIPASEMVRLRKYIPRIHGIRAALILASQLQSTSTVTSLTQNLQNMQKAQDDQAIDAQNMAEAWKRFSARAKMQQATVAINSMGLQVAKMFDPVFNFVSKGIVDTAQYAQKHRDLTKGVAIGAGSFLGALGIARFVGAGRFLPKGFPGRGLLGGGLGGAFVAERAITSLAATGLGASPQNPLYVIVVGTIFGGAVTGGLTPTSPFPDSSGKGNWLTRTLKSVGSAGASTWKILGPAGAATVAAAAAIPVLYNEIVRHTQTSRKIPPGHPILQSFENVGVGLTGMQNRVPTAAQQAILNAFAQGKYSADQAERMLKGTLDVNITVNEKDSSGKITKTKTVHVPAAIWQGGRTPGSRGKIANTQRGN